ncbi:MAG: PDZ domain-containing protein [Saprospiraceae bacterium]
MGLQKISKLVFGLLFVFFTLIFNTTLYGQPTKPRLLGNNEKTIIPFQYVNGFIVVDVIFQKIMPLKFILDTGAENTILLKREYADLLRVPYHKKIKLLGADMSEDIFAFVCNSTFLQMTNTPAIRHNIIVLETEFLLLEEFIGVKIDGILGSEFFKGLVLKIDYKNNMLTLYNPDTFEVPKSKDYHHFDIQLYGNKPYIICKTEVNPRKQVDALMLIDTGAGLSAMFHDNTDSLLKLKGIIVKGSLGKGLGGDIEGYSGKIHRLEIGTLYFNNMISSFQDLEGSIVDNNKIVRNGLLGNILLDRFDVIIDFLNGRLYLKPHKDYNKAFEFDRSGLTIFAYGERLDKFYIKYVTEHSPASEVDLRPGDIILKVGCFSYKWFTLRQINKKLSKKVGKKIKLKIKRGEEVMTKEIVLRDLFVN